MDPYGTSDPSSQVPRIERAEGKKEEEEDPLLKKEEEEMAQLQYRRDPLGEGGVYWATRGTTGSS